MRWKTLPLFLLLAASAYTQGTDYVAQVRNKPTVDARQYNWAPQHPGGTLSSGSNTITLNPMPLGINSLSVGTSWVYISSGTGTAEAAPITGVTSSTVTVTIANTHSGAWSVQSANAGIQEALNSSPIGHAVFVVAGTYTIYGPVSVPTPSSFQGFSVIGDSRDSTVLNVASSFPLTAAGVFIRNSSSPQVPIVYDKFTVTFIQPDSSNVATYTHWPAAFSFVGSTGAIIMSDVQVNLAWTGIDCSGGLSVTSCGQSSFRNVFMSAFNYGFNIDGTQDSIRIDGFHCWPFGTTTNQQTAFLNTSTVTCINSARMDDLHIANSTFLGGTGMNFYQSASGYTTAEVSNIDLESLNGIVMASGYVSVSSATFTQAGFLITGGQMTIASSQGILAVGASVPIIQADWTNGGSENRLLLTGITVFGNNLDKTFVSATNAGGSAGDLIVTGSSFYKDANVAYSNPIITVTGNATTATITGNSTYAKGSGAGTFASLTVDQSHSVLGNTTPGWSNVYPATQTTGVYQDSAQAIYGQAIPVTLKGGVTASYVNFILSETGALAAIAGSLPSPSNTTAPFTGLRVTILLQHGLTGGAGNTFNLNGTGAVAIKSSWNQSNNIATSLNTGSGADLFFNGAVWLLMGQ
jgi:hypothetical protein